MSPLIMRWQDLSLDPEIALPHRAGASEGPVSGIWSGNDRLMVMSQIRFGCLLIVFLLLAVTTAAEPTIRVASLRYGTLSWQLDVIAKHGLDKQEGIRLEPLELATTPAAQLALQAGSIDLIVSDWLWVSRQRAE